MTRPTAFTLARPVGWAATGGDPTLPSGQPPVDCCGDEEDQPDRALDSAAFIGTVVFDGYNQILDDGPDFYFRFQEPSGAFQDSSGNGVTMTEQFGSVTRGVTGPVPDGLAITATTSSLETSYDPPNTTVAETIEMWVKTTSTGKPLGQPSDVRTRLPTVRRGDHLRLCGWTGHRGIQCHVLLAGQAHDRDRQ